MFVLCWLHFRVEWSTVAFIYFASSTRIKDYTKIHKTENTVTIDKRLLTLAFCPLRYSEYLSFRCLLAIVCIKRPILLNQYKRKWGCKRKWERHYICFNFRSHAATTSTNSILLSVERCSVRENGWFRIFEVSCCGLQNSRICKLSSLFLKILRLALNMVENRFVCKRSVLVLVHCLKIEVNSITSPHWVWSVMIPMCFSVK